MFFIVYSCFAMFFYNCFTTLLYNVSFSCTVKWISYMYTCVPQDMEATYMSINRWVDKENVVHIYNGILLNIAFTVWMDLEINTLSEVSQTKTNIIQYQLCEISKIIQMNLYTKQKQTHRHRKQSFWLPKEKGR